MAGVVAFCTGESLQHVKRVQNGSAVLSDLVDRKQVGEPGADGVNGATVAHVRAR